MKTLILGLLITFGTLLLNGCERADYQHPMHRNGNR